MNTHLAKFTRLGTAMAAAGFSLALLAGPVAAQTTRDSATARTTSGPIADVDITVKTFVRGAQPIIVGRTGRDGYFSGDIRVESGTYQVETSCAGGQTCAAYRLTDVLISGRALRPNDRGEFVFTVDAGTREVRLEATTVGGEVSTTPGRVPRPTGSDPDTSSAVGMTDPGSTRGQARPARGAGADRLIGISGDERDARLGTDRLRSDETGETRAQLNSSGGIVAAERSATAGHAGAGATGTPAGCASGSHFPREVSRITTSQTGVGHTGNEELSNRDHIDQDAQRTNRARAASTGPGPGSDPGLNGERGTGGGRHTFVPATGIITNSERDEAVANRSAGGGSPVLPACEPGPAGPR